ncbi:MAG: 34-kDa subunit of RNA polymerase III (C) [Tremellales sp. Tagirdzhanova-0007]|nr:MAG: 34-kDa subunit of RNA polymerase III (C) [Tremellales sp. Tagirdzhanova-0007]
MATLSTSDQQVWKKVLAAKNKVGRLFAHSFKRLTVVGEAMNQKAIQISLPGMTTKEVTSSISALIKLQLLATEKGKDGIVIFHGQAADDAKKKSTFTAEQAIVLQTISQAGNNGISPKVLRNQIGPDVMPSTSLRRILDGLEKSNQVKVFKGINAPTVSLYILPHLKPPEEITGGIWFDTTKEYDAELVDAIHQVLLNHVRKLTFPKQCKDEQASGQHPIYSTDRTSTLPTPHALLQHVNKLNVTSVKLNVKNVMECMRALELDGLVEAVKPLGDVQVPEDEGIDDDDGHVGNMRKKRNGDDDDNDKRSNSETDSESDSDDSVSSVDSADLDGRVVQFKPKSSTAFAAAHSQSLSFAGAGLQDLSDTAIVYRATNRLTIPRGQNQTPCGKCPQFGFCEEEGPVNADSCRYYADWLGDRVGGWDAEGRNRFHPVDREYEEGPVTQDSEGEE